MSALASYAGALLVLATIVFSARGTPFYRGALIAWVALVGAGLVVLALAAVAVLALLFVCSGAVFVWQAAVHEYEANRARERQNCATPHR